MRPRREIDLRKLPARWQYAMALAVVAVVVVLVLAFGDRDSGPSWLTDTLPHILGVAAIVVGVCLLVMRLRRR
jgi:uncharacterized membrane protein HdeD (DUF308 family)